MGLFNRKKKEEEVIDNRSEVEKKFEEKGQDIGRKTGTLVQKGINKLDEVKQKLEKDGTMDKLRDFGGKVDGKIDKVVDKVAQKGKEVKKKVSKSKKKEEKVEDEYYQ